MSKETLIEKLLNEKAEKNNTIDLNAYALGLDDMYEAFVSYGVIQRKEQFKKKAEELFKKYSYQGVYGGDLVIGENAFDYLIEQLHESLTIPDVVGGSEQLKAFADYAQKRMWEDGDKDLSEFVDEFLSL